MRYERYIVANYRLFSTVSILCRNFMGAGSSKMSEIEPVLVMPKGRHSATVIFLHGLGDTGHGWMSAFQEIKEDHIKYVFPTAKSSPVSLNGGMAMPSWFDIKSLNFGGPEDADGLKRSSNYLVSLIEKEEKAGIPLDRIIIGGFSQGGAVAIHSAILSKKNVGGLLALSTWMPLHQEIMKVENWPKLKILQVHGKADPIVNFQFGEMTSKILSSHCPDYEFKSYDNLGHSSNPQEMLKVKEFLAKSLPPK